MSSKKKTNADGPQINCTKCNRLPSGKKVAVTCDSCKNLYCGDCHDLSPTELRVFELKTVGRVLSFLCKDCKSAITQLPMIMKKLNELTEEVKQLRMRQDITANESTIMEIAERANRAKNVIIYDIPESTSDEANQRKEHDVKESAAILAVVTDKVEMAGIKAFRLGAKPDGDGDASPRPLKVILRSKSDALEVLRNKKKLAKPTSIKADLTPQQQEYLKQLREELKRRIQEGETDITIRYIRGRPTIVQFKASIDVNDTTEH